MLSNGQDHCRRQRHGMAAALLVGVLVWMPDPAFAVDNPFYVNNISREKLVDLVCDGPVARSSSGPFSDGLTVDAETDYGQFYTATNGFGNQFGAWHCRGNLKDSDGPEIGLAFCLTNTPAHPEVFLVLSENREDVFDFEVEFFKSPTGDGDCPDGQEASSFLGDGPRRGPESPPPVTKSGGRPDRDHWIIDGSAGDLLTIRLSRDGSAGSLGEQATLVLRGHGAARALEKKVSGALPLELEEGLPAEATYSVGVEQHGVEDPDRFLGFYSLTLSSHLEEALSLRPHATVEP